MKNRTIKLSLIIALVAILTVVGVSATLAAYTTKIDGTITGTVAQWEFTAESEQAEVPFKFDLNKLNHNKAKHDKIWAGDTGSFTIKLTNNSDINAAYTIDLNAIAAENGVRFYLGALNEKVMEKKDDINLELDTLKGLETTHSLTPVTATTADQITGIISKKTDSTAGTEEITISWIAYGPTDANSNGSIDANENFTFPTNAAFTITATGTADGATDAILGAKA